MEKVTLKYGLYLVENENIRLKSDGLEHNEYIEYVKDKGICYEDGCLIGKDYQAAFLTLNNLGCVHKYNFYIQRVSESPFIEKESESNEY